MLNQISVFLPDSPGILASLLELLMDNKIYINAMTVAHSTDYGLLLLLVDKPEKCVELLEDYNYILSITEVIAIDVTDNENALYKIPKTLGDNKVNIEYLYSTLVKERAIIVLRVDNNEKGIELLQSQGFKIIETHAF